MMDTVTDPLNGQKVKVKPGDPRVWDGNTRINEMKRRVPDPKSKFTKDTDIPVEVFEN